MKQNAKCLGQK